MEAEPRIIDDRLIDWLLTGDVAIQYQVRIDLLDEDHPDLRVLRVLKCLGQPNRA